MNILIISDYSQLAQDFHLDMIKKGYNSTLLTTIHIKKANDVVNISRLGKKSLWLKNTFRSFFFRYIILNVDTKYAFYQDINENSDYYTIDQIKRKITTKPDLIFILFDYRVLTTNTIRNLFLWSKAKIYWMLVDMKPMTGGCSYSLNCNGYIFSCENCPAIRNNVFKNKPQKVINTKIINLKNVDINIITFSTDQFEQAKKSIVFSKKNIFKTFFPINKDIFQYRDKVSARNELGLNQNKKIIMFGAADIGEYRKGFSFLLKAINQLTVNFDSNNIHLIIVGNIANKKYLNFPFKTSYYGFVNFSKLALLYQASSVFVCPSIADSGPTMVNQSIMCGTPVIAFKMGVSLDLVVDGKTGYLAEIGSYEQLTFGLTKIINLSLKEENIMIENCRQMSNKIMNNDLFSFINTIL